MAWYSGVSGACCARPMGLVVSHGLPPRPAVGLRHWLSQSGYRLSLDAGAHPLAASVAARASAATAFRSGMMASLVSRLGCRAAESTSMHSGKADRYGFRSYSLFRRQDVLVALDQGRRGPGEALQDLRKLIARERADVDLQVACVLQIGGIAVGRHEGFLQDRGPRRRKLRRRDERARHLERQLGQLDQGLVLRGAGELVGGR